jgi:3-hydroxymyristoyl/3-hydroxydecanoyl-(acyl carrier protein) dehydratase
MPEHSRSPESDRALGTKTASRHLAIGHRSAEGHFPGNPIIPGAVLLGEIVAAVIGENHGGDAASRLEIRLAKFRHPVRPGATVVVAWNEKTDGEVWFSCSVAGLDRPAVTGTIRLAPS